MTLDIDWPARAHELSAVFAERAPAHDRDGTFPFENYADLRAAGFYGLTVPRRFGGHEVSLTTFLRVQEELAHGDGSTALSFNMHLVRFGGERDGPIYPERWFAEMCRGAIEDGWLANTVASEEGLGSPAGGGTPATTAVPTGEGWVLNGHKTFVTMAPVLHYCIVMAAVPSQEGAPSVANFMVFPTDPGVRVQSNWDTLGMRATGSHDMIFESAALPADRLMNQRGGTARPDQKTNASSTWFALGVSATTLGVARAARDYAVGFARERTPTGNRTIKEYPGVRAKVARIDLLLQRSSALIYDAAAVWERPPGYGMPVLDRVAVAKVETMNSCIEAVELAMRVVGGVGLRRERPIERYFRDVRVALHNPPLEDRALEQLAKAALD